MRTFAVLGTWLTLFAACAVSASAQGLPIEVVNPTDIPLDDHPVTFGIPVPEGFHLRATIGLSVVDGLGNSIPSQFRPLSRWGAQRDNVLFPLKWVQVTFLADCPPQDTATYYIRGAPAAEGDIVLHDRPDEIEVRTAVGTSFTVAKSEFLLFKRVIRDGQLLFTNDDPGLLATDEAEQPLTPILGETVVEESGGVRAVIRQRGSLGALRWTCRFFFHSGRSEVQVDFRLENPQRFGSFNGQPAGVTYLDSLALRCKAPGTLVTTSHHSATTQVPFVIAQEFHQPPPNDLWVGFSYRENLGESIVAAGQRHDGALAVSDGNRGVTVAVHRFWENFPKDIGADQGEILVGLWPGWGHGPEFGGQYGSPASGGPVDPGSLVNYRIEGGRWKSHRLVFAFHNVAPTSADCAAAATLLNNPPSARAPGWWYRYARGLSLLMMERGPWTDPSHQRYERMMDVLVDDAQADIVSSSLPRIGLPLFRRRGGTWGNRQFYGWENFGDLIWADGASSLHYDWPASMLLQWIRGGRIEFLHDGHDMAWHRRDYDQNHTTDTTETWRGCQFYEKGWWHGNFSNGKTSHNWIHGVLLHYALTGEEASYEAALEGVGFLLRESPGNFNGYWGARGPGWTLDGLVHAWNYLGIDACRVEARAGILQFEALEQINGGQGYVLNYGSGPPGQQILSPWQHGILFNAASRYTWITGDQTALPLLDRMRTFFKNEILLPGNGSAGAYRLPAVYDTWSPQNGGQNPSNHLGWVMCENMTWSGLLFDDAYDQWRALELFECLTRYHQGGPQQVVDITDPTSYSKISARMLGFPNTESKILGHALLWGQAGLSLRGVAQGLYE
jgi:hypothetical protein